MSFEKKLTVTIPAWLPDDVRNYLMHTVYGQGIRALGRQAGQHASTILRQIRKVEGRRDDPLVDAALKALSSRPDDGERPATALEQLQALRRLSDPGAILAIARGMDVGVIVRDGAGADPICNIDLRIARTLALRDWIELSGQGDRIARYRITAQGRAGYRDLVALSENRARAMAEGPAPFRHKTGPEAEDDTAHPQLQTVRLASSESPVQALARRRDKAGQPFLSAEMVRAAERLREDFEVAHVAAGGATNWDHVLTGAVDGGRGAADGSSRMDARARVEAAFAALGPGLSEVVYRTCCLLDGLEETERRMSWSARSGKIVLRIALQRLALHYEASGHFRARIG